MKLVEVADDAGLHDLKPAWETLLQSFPTATIFQTWEWAAAWWSSYGKPAELRILAAFDDSGVLRGLAPLRSEFVRKYGQTVPALSFLGDGSNDSDYLDFIVAPGYEAPVMQTFTNHLAGDLRRGSVLRLNEIPNGSSILTLLDAISAPGEFIRQDTDGPCGAVALPRDWEDYLAMLRPRFRSKIRSTLRNLESRAEVRFGICQTPEQLDALLPVLFDLHTRRWATEGKLGVFGWDQKRKFYFMISHMLLERGWLRFTWLQWNDRILACQYGFEYRSVYFQLQEGYEPEAEHWNPGIGLRAWSIRKFIQDGLREYDFLGGMGRHKSDWGAALKHSKRIRLARPTIRNLLFCRGPEWQARTKEALRKLAPEKVLAARKAYLQKRVQAAVSRNGNDNGAAATGESWMRKTAARLYVDSPLPRLMRPLRDHYQVSLSRNKWPGISWERRAEGSGRILYYHRVNEERDPFFPASATQLFEQQISFVARHYKVLPLSELLDRLERGDALGSMAAITFDDGYQDNYHCAFPILRKYGLQATIFLTTGGIDDRRPLWFERLAGAVKRTNREFIDVEIDLPRRFWLRTQEERLQANGRIFSLLRKLPDATRRTAYQELLQRLDTPEDEDRNNRMLTWDQIREMRRDGIEFGGHTVTHPFLSKMTREGAAWELAESKRRIENELQASVKHFAYPNGREDDFAPWNKELLRAAGYCAAVTTIWGLNSKSTDRLELRRGQPWEADQALFAWKLDWYGLVNE